MNKGVHYRLVNQNTLSALNEMLALANFEDIINNINFNKATQLLFDRINNGFKLCCRIRTKTLSPKNTSKPWISGEICANIKNGKTIIHLLDKIKCLINSTHDLEILSQIKLGKQKLIIFPANLNNLREIVKALVSK